MTSAHWLSKQQRDARVRHSTKPGPWLASPPVEPQTSLRMRRAAVLQRTKCHCHSLPTEQCHVLRVLLHWNTGSLKSTLCLKPTGRVRYCCQALGLFNVPVLAALRYESSTPSRKAACCCLACYGCIADVCLTWPRPTACTLYSLGVLWLGDEATGVPPAVRGTDVARCARCTVSDGLHLSAAWHAPSGHLTARMRDRQPSYRAPRASVAGGLHSLVEYDQLTCSSLLQHGVAEHGAWCCGSSFVHQLCVL
jgi:hypothetical protein